LSSRVAVTARCPKFCRKQDADYPVDLHDRGYGKLRDVFSYESEVENIVTNPPFNIAEQIILHMMPLFQRNGVVSTHRVRRRVRYHGIYHHRRLAFMCSPGV